MEEELLELMSDTITVEPPSGTYSDRGQPSFGAAVTYPCRIEPSNGDEIVRSASGEERKAAWIIYVGTTTTINPESRLTLPSGFTPQQPPFFACGRQADETTSHHQVLLV